MDYLGVPTKKERDYAKLNKDARSFTASHHEFKNKMMTEFSNFCSDHSKAPLSILYLDHWCDEPNSIPLCATEVFLSTGHSAKKLFCPNPDETTFKALVDRGVSSVPLEMSEALCGPWKNESFDAVYADFYYACPYKTIAEIEPVLTSAKVVACTLTRREEGMMEQRLDRLEDFMNSKGFLPAHKKFLKSHHYLRPSSVLTLFWFKKPTPDSIWRRLSSLLMRRTAAVKNTE
jgi:hypothetical protein